MQILEQLKRGRPEYLSVIDLFEFIWNNFEQIKEPQDLFRKFKKKLIDYTDSPESKKVYEISGLSGHLSNHKSIIFWESSKIYCNFDIDFISGKLANFRLQIFGAGLFSKRRVSQKRDLLFNLINGRLPNEKYEFILKMYSQIWRDNQNGLIITLREVTKMIIGQPPSISVAIMAKEYSGL